MNKNKIDFVITWVDGNDPKWIEEKNEYSNVKGDKRENRFRDWDNLEYLFRGIEKFAPWVNKVFFVTWGHLPSWLNTDNEKLVVVNHKDFIPEKYLPTFSANPIELNLHRLKGLSENFVFFNDDTFIINKLEEEDFFKSDLPCNAAVLSPVFALDKSGFQKLVMNDMYLINKHFNKKESMKGNFSKWFSLNYGKELIKTIFLNSWDAFSGFMEEHNANSYNKSTFEKVWSEEEEILDRACLNKFRNVDEDVNQYLMKYWQICSGKFFPRKLKNLGYFEYNENNDEMYSAIINQKKKLVCLNDVEGTYDFEKEKERTKAALDKILGEKCSFEK